MCWTATATHGHPAYSKRDVIRLLLLTGCRRSEILTLRWQDIDGDTLNLVDAKTGPRRVFLNAPARVILERQPRSGSAYVFPSPVDSRRPLSCNLRLWYSVRREERSRAEPGQGLDDAQRERILALASDFPRLWNDPATPHRERKRMARLLIEDVTLTKATRSLGVRLRGGATRQIAWTPDIHPSQLIKTSAEVVAEVDRLMNDHTYGEIAAILNRRGYRTGHGHAFDPISVRGVRINYALKSRRDRLRERGLLTALEIAARFGVSDTTVYRWHGAGLLRAHAYSDRPRYLYEILDPLPTEKTGPSPKQGPFADLADQRSIEVQYGT